MKWYQAREISVTIACKIKPNARKSAILGIEDNNLVISLTALPVDGAANQALIKFLAKLFKLPSHKVVLIRGQTSRYKVVALPKLPDLLKQLANFDHVT